MYGYIVYIVDLYATPAKDITTRRCMHIEHKLYTQYCTNIIYYLDDMMMTMVMVMIKTTLRFMDRFI